MKEAFSIPMLNPIFTFSLARRYILPSYGRQLTVPIFILRHFVSEENWQFANYRNFSNNQKSAFKRISAKMEYLNLFEGQTVFKTFSITSNW